MLRKIILFGLIFCLLQTVFAADYTSVDVRTAFTDPYPVEPGRGVELSIEVSNTGNEQLDNIIIEIKPSLPFTLLENPTIEIDVLQIGSSRIIEYEMFVDDSAVSTVYKIPVEITYDNSLLKKEIRINVQGRPDFKLLEMTSDVISPGDQAKISIEISNVGTGKAKRTTAAFTSDSTHIKPIFSGGNVYIGDFGTEETKEIDFIILAGSDAEYGVYTGSIQLDYQDEAGNRSTTSFDVGILVSGEPHFQIIKNEVKMDTQELEVELTNMGTAEAKAINGKLMIDGKVFDVDYVTNVKIDKRTTLKFNLPRGGTGELKLSYEGPDNKEYTQTEILTWNVPVSIPSWIWIIVILIIVYVFWKKKIWKKIF